MDLADKERLRVLWADHSISASKIGERLGYSKNQIIGVAHRMKLPQRPCVGGWRKQSKLTEEQQKRIILLRLERWSLRDINRELGRPVAEETLRQFLRSQGIRVTVRKPDFEPRQSAKLMTKRKQQEAKATTFKKDGRKAPPNPVVIAPKPSFSLPVVIDPFVGGCRYLLNDGTPWKFCGDPIAKSASSYCERHHKLCHGGTWSPGSSH